MFYLVNKNTISVQLVSNGKTVDECIEKLNFSMNPLDQYDFLTKSELIERRLNSGRNEFGMKLKKRDRRA